MKDKILHHLNPKNLLVDDRTTDDLILFINKLSKYINYYNSKNIIDGNWSGFFSDQTFLLSEISNFKIEKYENERLNLIKNFDEFSSEKQKEETLKDFFHIIYIFFKNVDVWYGKALKNNLSIKSSSIENELEQAIQNKLKNYFDQFFSYTLSFKETNNFNFSFDHFNSIWNFKLLKKKNIFSETDLSQSPYSSALKKLILLYNPIYEVLFSLKKKSKFLFTKSLESNDNHNPHIGLLFSFLELFKNHQADINNLPKRHLDFYYKSILKQKLIEDKPNQVYVNIEIDENIDSLVIGEGEILIAGQELDGDDILYKTNHEIVLNNSKISEISSLYVSRNKKLDFNSSFRLVSGIFSKQIANSIEEVNDFNYNNELFSSLGEDQTFISSQFKSMESSKLGFAVSSPTLLSANSNREVMFDFYFTIDSIQYLSNLIIDISNNTQQSEEKVFSDIFSNSFDINYTSNDSWVPISNYNFEYPEDWSKGIISIKIILDKSLPPISNYVNEVHDKNIESGFPVFEFLLSEKNFYYPYSFLNGIEINKIDINLSVSNLKNLKILNELGSVSNDSDFEMFGPSPEKGSKLYIGNAEIFSKKIQKLTLGWDYTNLPYDHENFEGFYKDYNYSINNDSFKIKLEALSDYSYRRNVEDELIYNLFNSEENKLMKSRIIENIDCDVLKLKPSYNLTEENIDIYSNDLESGYIKLELVNPVIGFGFNYYPKLLEKTIENASKIKSKKDSNEQYSYPNEPYCPKISDIYLNYSSKTSILFNESNEDGNDSFFLVHPNEGYNRVSSNLRNNINLIPELKSQGELTIGFNKIKPLQDLNLLFEIEKNEHTNYKFSSNLEWFYSSFNGWKKIEKSNILYDETSNLMKTGVICFKLNSDLSTKSVNIKNEKFYLKACSKNQVDQFSLIKKIIPNSVSATQEIKLNSSNNKLLPNSIQSFKEPIQGIVNLNQILPSFGGVKKETDIQFYKRISELLSHKNRPKTTKDIENFLLSKFNWISYAKCYYDKMNSVKCLCMKRILSEQNIDEIKLSQADISLINDCIKNFVSPFLNLEIINPTFEEVWIKGKVKFLKIPSGKGVFTLNKDLLNYFCPWIKDGDFKNINIGGSFKRSEIINFIKSRPYISFITGISIIHIRVNQNGNKEIYDSASDENLNNLIKTGSDHSILIPIDYNQIEIIENEKYFPPEKTNFSDLNIEENFIISTEDDKSFRSNIADTENNEEINKRTFTFKF